MVVNAILSVNNMVAKIKHIFKTYVGSDNTVDQRHSALMCCRWYVCGALDAVLCCADHLDCAYACDQQASIVFQGQQVVAIKKWCWYSLTYQTATTCITRKLPHDLPDNKTCNVNQCILGKLPKASWQVAVVQHHASDILKWRGCDVRVLSWYHRRHVHSCQRHSVVLCSDVACFSWRNAAADHEPAENTLEVNHTWIVVPSTWNS